MPQRRRQILESARPPDRAFRLLGRDLHLERGVLRGRDVRRPRCRPVPLPEGLHGRRRMPDRFQLRRRDERRLPRVRRRHERLRRKATAPSRILSGAENVLWPFSSTAARVRSNAAPTGPMRYHWFETHRSPVAPRAPKQLASGSAENVLWPFSRWHGGRSSWSFRRHERGAARGAALDVRRSKGAVPRSLTAHVRIMTSIIRSTSRCEPGLKFRPFVPHNRSPRSAPQSQPLQTMLFESSSFRFKAITFTQSWKRTTSDRFRAESQS
jgi:hypothetical protein